MFFVVTKIDNLLDKKLLEKKCGKIEIIICDIKYP